MKLSILFFLLLSSNAVAAESGLKMSFSNETITFAVDDLALVYVSFDPQSNDPIVVFRLSAEKAKQFELTTGRHIGEAFNIEVCNLVVSSPRIMEAIRGRDLHITGGFDIKQANALAEVLNTSTCAKQ
jgi:SecD/SecF fusion protein